MESTEAGAFMGNRRFESYCHASSGLNLECNSKVVAKDELPKQPVVAENEDDDDGWCTAFISCIRIVVCFVMMMFTTLLWGLIMLVLLPWPLHRIMQGNVYGHVTGRLLIIWYPLFGQLYVLANHLRIDRSDPCSAIKSMNEAVRTIIKKNLSLIIFPEGTRSKNGRLLPFKKGFVHLALQSHLPIIPIVLTGTHLAWRKGSLHVRPAPLTVKYLPPIKTDDWTSDKVEDYVAMVHDVFVKHLPESQRPLA